MEIVWLVGEYYYIFKIYIKKEKKSKRFLLFCKEVSSGVEPLYTVLQTVT